MDAYSLSDARANLAELLTRAESGEIITITRHGVPAGVLLGHRRWMKTETHDVLIQGRRVGRLLEEARSKPFPELPNVPNYDGEAHADEIRRNRGSRPVGRATVTDAFDSDVLILAASGEEAGAVARAAFALGGPAIGSVLLLPEILSKPLRLGWKVELEALTDLLAHIELKEVDFEIAQASVAVGAKYGLRAADAVHLATAIVWGADRFHSNNRKDFGQRISEIDVIVPNPT